MEKPSFPNFQEEVSSAMDVCLHLALGMCPCTTPETHAFASSSSIKKTQLHDDDHSSKKTARKRARGDIELRWGFSLDLMLYDDPWKIKKVLLKSDIGNMSRLLLSKELADKLVLPVLGADAQRDAESVIGTRIRICDIDTNTMHTLVFKRWRSSGSYVFAGKWVQDFVKRRGLKIGDEIGLHWDPYNNLFNFTVFHHQAM